MPRPHDIRKEPLIRKKWEFANTRPSTYPDGILITGANAFIGAHVVNMLQHNHHMPVYLLLRAVTYNEAVQKMNNAFEKWQLGSFDAARFTICLGDVTLNRMGLNTAEHLELAQNTGFVLHLVMNPLYNLPYNHFQRLWIPELERMITFCGDKKHPKSLHYPSSYNANFFISDNSYKQLNQNAWHSGYAGFKWVANKAIENAFFQNLNGCLYEIPMVLGSEDKGKSPSHYILWHILDLFLRSGMYIDFEFKIIPVDLLAGIMVSNLLADKEDKREQFLRPVLSQPVTHKQFSQTVANILGLKHVPPRKLRDACTSKHNFDFLFPVDFYSMIENVNALPAIFPQTYDKQNLPTALMVFLSNLNSIISQTENVKPNQ